MILNTITVVVLALVVSTSSVVAIDRDEIRAVANTLFAVEARRISKLNLIRSYDLISLVKKSRGACRTRYILGRAYDFKKGNSVVARLPMFSTRQKMKRAFTKIKRLCKPV